MSERESHQPANPSDTTDAPIEGAADGTLIGGASDPLSLRLRASIDPIVLAHGLTLVGVELTREGRRPVLWVYIDRPDGGVTIDDCALVSPELSAALDVDDPLPDAYELRVSSPGLDRPLMSAGDFRRYQGREVQLQLFTPLGGRRKFTGELSGVHQDTISVRCADGEHQVPLAHIQRARLRYEVTIGKARR